MTLTYFTLMINSLFQKPLGTADPVGLAFPPRVFRHEPPPVGPMLERSEEGGAWDLSHTPAPFGGSVRRVEDTRRQSRGSGGGWEK